jgi:hypothetical protein
MTATVLSGPERRRRWTRAEKLRLVEETLAPEAELAEVFGKVLWCYLDASAA